MLGAIYSVFPEGVVRHIELAAGAVAPTDLVEKLGQCLSLILAPGLRRTLFPRLKAQYAYMSAWLGVFVCAAFCWSLSQQVLFVHVALSSLAQCNPHRKRMGPDVRGGVGVSMTSCPSHNPWYSSASSRYKPRSHLWPSIRYCELENAHGSGAHLPRTGRLSCARFFPSALLHCHCRAREYCLKANKR